ncbi:unnamed protein product [marine sediment metagenome]|uniref:Uncharacterized protein n=1 Tax=marine sediment metagenome TaxID=412755 RepID=X1MGT8_9ZZZZ
MLEDVRYDSFPHVLSLKNSGRAQDINYFRDFFDSIFQLSNVEVNTSYGLTAYGACRPFMGFLDSKNNKISRWWDAYNHVKHGWYVNIKEATLKNTIEALAGLFVLNILHKESQEYLIKYHDVITGEFYGLMPRGIVKLFSVSMIGKPRSYRNIMVMAKTPLFMHVFRVDNNVTI